MDVTINSKDHIPKVSIGMPVYNGENFIREALDSLLAQTFTVFELIISDNASTDSTSLICREYANKDKRIKYIRQTENRGAQFNFWFVCQKACGDYFMWAAADDTWDKDFIKILYKAIVMDKNNVSAFCPYTCTNEKGQFVGDVRKRDYSGNIIRRLYKFIWCYDDGFWYGLFKKNIINNVKFPTWWGINSNVLANACYPPLFFILSSGNFVFTDSVPLMFKRLHNYKQYQFEINSENRILKYYSFFLRKINVFFESIKNIYSGSNSLLITVICLPGLAIRCVYDCTVHLTGVTIKIIKQFINYKNK